MVRLDTERLVILAIPSTERVPDLRRKRAVKDFLRLKTGLKERSNAAGDAEFEKRLEAQADCRCVCVSSADEAYVGEVTTDWDGEAGVITIGYSVVAKYRGLGYATEAVRAVVDWVLSGPDLKAVVSETYSDWTPSIRIMEKVGMSRVETDLGPDLVRYAVLKPGAEIDLSEPGAQSLLPFRYPRSYRAAYLAKWQWWRIEETIPLLFFVSLIVARPNDFLFALGLVGFSAYGLYILGRLVGWARAPGTEALIHLRERGLFYATRGGFGRVWRWRTFPYYRLSKRGGIELWNGSTWYWIPPQAFSEGAVPMAQKYLADHGVREHES